MWRAWRHPRCCLELPRTAVGRGWARHAASGAAAPTSQARVGDSYDSIRCFTAAEFPGAIYLSQTLEFRKPVFVGETVLATIQVQGVRASGRMLDFETRCTNQKGELVLMGGARCLLPRGSPIAASREGGLGG